MKALMLKENQLDQENINEARDIIFIAFFPS